MAAPALTNFTLMPIPRLRKVRVSPKPLLLAFLSPLQKNITKFLVEKIATILLGSLIFMGRLNSRPGIPFYTNWKKNPGDIEALKMVVKVKLRTGKTSDSAEYVERLIELQPDEMEWRMLQASCYELMGNLSNARSLFKKILKLNPLLVGALHGLAMAMHKNQEGLAVFDMLERALELARKTRRVNLEQNIRILVAQMHFMKITTGDAKVAKEEFQALIDEDPGDFPLYVCQGVLYTLMGKRNKAAKYSEMYQKLVPEEHHLKKILDNAVQFAQNGTKPTD
ncbi:hypothetical protein CDL12_00366 [Handroanthus impetiginosus]|uniref:Uncharacterized protein n=1 Tax=Handroanthus impetiginosus TaxID=429701 RepID=A0A2G9IAU8_9LAMI|nr:hypothetical protein CDL12_00366 [Handroanthus impetiginosus]